MRSWSDGSLTSSVTKQLMKKRNVQFVINMMTVHVLPWNLGNRLKTNSVSGLQVENLLKKNAKSY